jgi:hypothetical protein
METNSARSSTKLGVFRTSSVGKDQSFVIFHFSFSIREFQLALKAVQMENDK